MKKRDFILLCVLSILKIIFVHSGVYDQNINLFNVEGRLLQVEYSEKASKRGSPLVAFTHEDRIIVIIKSTPSDTLSDRKIIDKIQAIDHDKWIVFSGLLGDSREILRLSKTISSNWRQQLGVTAPVYAVASKIGQYQHEATITGGRRPLGVEALLLGYEDGFSHHPNNAAIYSTTPSGLVSKWRAIAIGQDSDTILKKLESESHMLNDKISFATYAYNQIKSTKYAESNDHVSNPSKISSNSDMSSSNSDMDYHGCDIYMITINPLIDEIHQKKYILLSKLNVTTTDSLIDFLRS